MIDISLETYLKSKEGLWATSTIKSTRARLKNPELTKAPEDALRSMQAQGRKLYGIKTAFLLNAAYRKEMFGDETYARFMRKHAYVFRNVYHEKTRRATREQVEYLLRRAKSFGPGYYNLLILLSKAGLRLSEALNTKWSDLDQKTSLITVTGKGGKLRQVPISLPLLLPTSTVYVCETPKLRYHRFFRKWGKLENITPHDLRAYYITTLVNSKQVSLKAVMQIVGHEDLKTTQRYLRVDRDHEFKILFLLLVW